VHHGLACQQQAQQDGGRGQSQSHLRALPSSGALGMAQEGRGGAFRQDVAFIGGGGSSAVCGDARSEFVTGIFIILVIIGRLPDFGLRIGSGIDFGIR
jgi:hypothetical protein